ncbi:NUDIX domain-containing protein [Streptomyces sp. NPDC059743]|uniref:NUDIX domain-containing protein n=1 Tax=Streptomyces sp. NPDC059743 TaxID=3346928 RepID=UPI003667A972
MLILEQGEYLLLAERAGGYAAGQLNLPSGKVEFGEDVFEAVAREGQEEVGVTIHRDSLRIVHVMQYKNPEGGVRLSWFLATSHWDGEPVNAEPDKCARIMWCKRSEIPDNTYESNALGIQHYLKGEPHSVHGWVSRA